jgi:hypothetical protein
MRITNLFFNLIVSLLFISNVVAQSKSEIDVRNLDIESFPLIKGDLWVRDPNGIKTSDIQFLENDKKVNVTFTDIKKNKTIAKNKAVVFLVLMTKNENEQNWYKSILNYVATNDLLSDGDLVDVITFSCKNDSELISPTSISFTSDKNEFIKRVSAISSRNKSNCGLYSQIHLSINEVLKEIEKVNTKLPTSLVVLSDNAGMKTQFAGETPGVRSLRLNIPIYAITYSKKVKNTYTINDLCEQTYGVFYQNNSNNLSDAQSTLKDFLEGALERNAGYNYSFSYNSTLSKDSKTHTIKVNTAKNGQTAFIIQTPNKNIFEWIKDNKLLSFLFFLLVILGLIVFFILFRRNKESKKALEEKRKNELYERDQQQRNADAKIEQQKKELELIQQQEREKQQKEEEERQQQLNEDEEKNQVKKMLEKGNFPWFVFGFGNETGNYQIQRCKLKVGRSPENDWTVNHPSVSKQHFILTFKDYVYTIEDLNSTNGLIVNGNRVAKTQLKHGDLIQIGDITLTFYI